MTNLNELKEKYKALGEEIERLEAEPSIDHEKLAYIMPEGVICEVWDKFPEKYNAAMYVGVREGICEGGNNYPFATKNHMFQHIRFNDKPILPWFGGKCPVADEVKVRVWLRNGNINRFFNTVLARWEWLDRYDDIVAYQVQEWAK